MTKRTPKTPPARAIQAILVLQIGIAGFLFARDITGALPRISFAPLPPALDSPVGPGDQTRRFDPAAVPNRPAAPGVEVPPGEDMPSRLQFQPDPAEPGVMRMSGTIATGDAERFADWFGTTSFDLQVVALHSPGGSVTDALDIGRILRAEGIDTRVDAGRICLSACPYLLAAGESRQVDDGAWVGVHQHYFDENTILPAFMAVADIQRGQGEVLEYLIEMDIDPRLMRHALVTPPEEIYILVREELEGYRLVTPAEPTG